MVVAIVVAIKRALHGQCISLTPTPGRTSGRGSVPVYFPAGLRARPECGTEGARSQPTIMPVGPHGEKRPADTLANALHVARVLTGDAEEEYVSPARQAAARKGGEARAAALSPERRREIARKGTVSRRRHA